MPHKTCSMDCIYCECGCTDRLTTELREYTPVERVLEELDAFLSSAPRLDVITFSGSGEPTLHSGIGDVIRHLKERYPQYRIAVLTNGSLLWRPEVRRAIVGADLVIPSLDAVSQEAFGAINRPAAGITPSAVVRGLGEFRREYSGRLILEIFIVPGINDTDRELSLLREACLAVGPDLVQLNTLDRPGTEGWVAGVDRGTLKRISRRLAPLEVEITGTPEGRGAAAPDTDGMILATLRRRPSTLDDLASAMGLSREETERRVLQLKAAGMLEVERGGRGVFFRLRERGREM
ncbi:MAG: radical SAM protein [Spirochaetes bacterium]|nr:radical SAM protein [Spirochaetota bacterium]